MMGCGPRHGTECGTKWDVACGMTQDMALHSVAHGTAQDVAHAGMWHRMWHMAHWHRACDVTSCGVPGMCGTGHMTPCATCHSPVWAIAAATLSSVSCSPARVTMGTGPPTATSPAESKILRPGHVSPWSHSFPVCAVCRGRRTARLCCRPHCLSQSQEHRHWDGHHGHLGTLMVGQCHHEAAWASLACCG